MKTPRPGSRAGQLSVWFLLCTVGPAWGCDITVSGVTFGAYEPLWGGAKSSVGSVEVRCPEQTSYGVQLDSGQAGSASPSRQLQNAHGHVLEYNLYQDVAHQVVWGNGSNGGSVLAGSADSQGTMHPVYGHIPGGQNIPAGHYADTVIVTVEY